MKIFGLIDNDGDGFINDKDLRKFLGDNIEA
jgi:Ca2+-binding EF-hand superfamily protein